MAGGAAGPCEALRAASGQFGVEFEGGPSRIEHHGVAEEGLGGDGLAGDARSAPRQRELLAAGGFEHPDVDRMSPGGEVHGTPFHDRAVDSRIRHHLAAVDLQAGAVVGGQVEVPATRGRDLDFTGEVQTESIATRVGTHAGDRNPDRIDVTADRVDRAHAVEVTFEVVQLQAGFRGGRLRHVAAGQQERGDRTALVPGERE